MIAKSVLTFQENTCVRIVARTTEKDYIVVKKDPGQSCASPVGYSHGRQSMTLATRCVEQYGSTIHEFMHVLGFHHEQSRLDRDDYIKVLFENIQDSAKGNFKKTETDGNSMSPYDLLSITHYSKSAFSKNGKDTLVPKKGEGKIGQRYNLTEV